MPSTLSHFGHQLASAVRAFAFIQVPSRKKRSSTVPAVTPLNQSETEQRTAGLYADCDLLANGFDDLGRFMQDYIQEVPLVRQDGTADAEQFLEWLATHRELTESQRDAIVCQQSRYTVEFVAMKKRLSNARFQELLSNNKRLLRELTHNRTIRIHLNPAFVWATLETQAFFDEPTSVPARVMFYPVKDSVCGAVIEDELLPLLRKLERGHRSFNELRWTSPRHDSDELLEIVQELARLGILALA